MSQQQGPADSAATGGRVMLRLVAILPPLVTAIAFAIAWLRWGSGHAVVMAKTIQLEFLVIHAGLFLGVFILVPIETALFRILRWVAVALFAYLYMQGAHSLFGWLGVLMIGGIFLGTYGAFLVPTATSEGARASRGRRAAEMGVRWAVSFLAYGLISKAFELPELVNTWGDHRGSVGLGAAYFALLAAVECTPLYPRIRG